MDFIRGKDPKDTINIGKKALIRKWLDEIGINNYSINEDYSIDVKGNVDISKRGIEELPEFIKFGIIYGNFYSYKNNLISLRGFPNEVTYSLICFSNKLTSLEFAPKKVGHLNCSYNKLTSLEFLPEITSGGIDCSYNRLTSIEGCPSVLKRGFDCSHNRLTSLKGGPKRIKTGFYDCSHNRLTSLRYAPSKVEEHFSCKKNKIKSLRGLKATIDGHFDCRNNEITDLNNVSLTVGRNFECYNNPTKFTSEYVKEHIKVGKRAIVIMPYTSDAYLHNK